MRSNKIRIGICPLCSFETLIPPSRICHGCVWFAGLNAEEQTAYRWLLAFRHDEGTFLEELTDRLHRWLCNPTPKGSVPVDDEAHETVLAVYRDNEIELEKSVLELAREALFEACVARSLN